MYMSHLQAPKTQPYRISLREFSFPCPFICWHCFFFIYYVKLILQRRAGSNLFILKEAKKNYMGRFIFSRGWGSIRLFLCQKMHNLFVCVAVFLGCTSTGRRVLCFLWFYVQELPKAQPAVVLVLKRLRRRGNGLKSHPTDWEKPGIEPATPGLQDIGLSPTPRRHLFCAVTLAATFNIIAITISVK